jgi:putative membrane protein
MVNRNRWGTAAIVAALALGTPALAQSGSQMGTGGQRDPATGTTRGSDSSMGSSQGSSGSSDTTAGSTTGSGSTTSSSRSASAGTLDKGLAEAVERLHANNQAEIEMGKMGQQMATSQDVKDYSQKLADDHQKNDQKLTSLAGSLGVDLNGKAFQDEQKHARKEMEKLHGKSGADFDKAFMSMMVKDHKKDVKDVQKATDDARKKNQTELASYLAATHTGLEGHLQAAERIEKDLKSGKSAAASGTSGSMGTGSSSGSSGSMGTGSSSSPSGGATSPGGGTGGSTTGGSGTSGSGSTGTTNNSTTK